MTIVAVERPHITYGNLGDNNLADVALRVNLQSRSSPLYPIDLLIVQLAATTRVQLLTYYLAPRHL
jgi:hypothetical protein